PLLRLTGRRGRTRIVSDKQGRQRQGRCKAGNNRGGKPHPPSPCVDAGGTYRGCRDGGQPGPRTSLRAAVSAPVASSAEATAFQPAKDSPRKRQEATPQIAGTRLMSRLS